MTATTVDAFKFGLYAEHVEDAAFLRAQRDALRVSEGGWRRVRAIEERLVAHLDALCVGGRMARSFCRDLLADAEADVRFVIAAFACLDGDADLLTTCMATLAPDDALALRAVGDACKLALPRGWQPFLVRAIDAGPSPWRGMLLDVAGALRFDCGPPALAALDAHPLEAARALGRIRHGAGAVALRALVEHDSPLVRLQASIALLRIGDRSAVDRASRALRSDPLAPLVLAIGGPVDAASALADLCRERGPTPAAIAGLGLIGDGTCWKALLACLDHAAHAPAAARALYLMTGAPLHRTGFVPEASSPDEWFDHEREAAQRTASVPQRADGRPYGTFELAPSVDREAWLRWAGDRRLEFVAGRRVRLGAPFGPDSAVAALADDLLHPQLRWLALEELGVRFGEDRGLELDQSVAGQARRLAELGEWAADVGRHGSLQMPRVVG